MVDVKEIRANPERMREAIALRNVDPAKADLDRWLELDERRRVLRAELEKINGEKNKLAGLGKTDVERARVLGQELRERARKVESELSPVMEEWQEICDWFPNWPHAEMPHGRGEEENIVAKAWVPRAGYLNLDKPARYSQTARLMPSRPVHSDNKEFTPLDHIQLGEQVSGIDVTQSAKVSGSRFAYITGDVALLQIAIQRLLTEKLLKIGYSPIVPPLLVRERSLYGTSHFPEARNQVYEIKPNNVEDSAHLFLVGTSEATNFSFFMDRTLREQDLPVKMFASTPCFRSEAGSWGKDVRGIVHGGHD